MDHLRILSAIAIFLALVSVSLAAQASNLNSETLRAHYGPKPEIVHQFRQPDKRPPQAVSDTFTALTALPLLVLFVLWAKIGVNLNDLHVSLSALVFHSSLAAIFGLYVMFWIRLNMFTTVKCLLGISIVALISGRSLLRALNSKRKVKAA
ncbi:Dolichyl-diphosphooligosaccharide--protein glycosyltransferase subunit 2 [Halotydeus destructor]|nr:Dolichyl-diphosphooligosaccharide--protein glycosyltransferase subunit 2 [Halotydeus destructor]